MPSNHPPIQFRDVALRGRVVERTGREDAPAVNARAREDLRTYYRIVDRLLAQNPVTEKEAGVLIAEWVRTGSVQDICKSMVLTWAYDDACRRYAHVSDYGSAGFIIKETT